MNAVWETVAVAFGMFSTLPLPQPVWNQRNMRYALCAFPLVGAVCGAAWAAWAAACAVWPVPELLRGAGFCLLPLAVTGGIHLDGYADTCDALSSHAAPARKQEILKDPHCGAFAVIRLCGWFVLDFALCCVFLPTRRAVGCMGLAFLLSRALSGYAVAAFPLAKNTGLAHTFAAAADRCAVRRALTVLAAVLAAALCLAGGWCGAGMAAAALLTLRHFRRTAQREFGGLSGDLAGWFLQRCELYLLAVLVGCQLLGVEI